MAIEFSPTDFPGKPLYDKQFNIEIKKVTPIEQKYILSLSQKESRTSKDYVEFLKKLIRFDNPEMTLEELYWFDLQYLLYKIRYVTYNKYPIKLSFECEDCNANIIEELNIGELEINEPDLEKSRELDFETLGKIKVRNKKVKDDITIETFIKKHNLDENDLQTKLLILDLCLISENEQFNNNIENAYMAAEQGDISVQDIAAVEDWFINDIWGFNEQLLVKCKKCGKEVSKRYYLSIEDFFSII